MPKHTRHHDDEPASLHQAETPATRRKAVLTAIYDMLDASSLDAEQLTVISHPLPGLIDAIERTPRSIPIA